MERAQHRDVFAFFKQLQSLHRYKVSYVSARHENSKIHITTYYSRSPSLHMKGDWIKEGRLGPGWV
jgi:hypothetical protein